MIPKAAYMPTQEHTQLTKSLSPTEAEHQIATFLAKSENEAYLHPDSRLSMYGIDFGANYGPSGGLAFYHLRRVLAGVRGEHLGAATTEELEKFVVVSEPKLPAGDDSKLDAQIADANRRKRKSSEDVAEWVQESADATFAREGQDLEEYQLQQEPLEGEVGERDGAPVVKQNGMPPTIAQEEHGEKRGKTDAERAARKAEKKAKKKEEKAARQNARQASS